MTLTIRIITVTVAVTIPITIAVPTAIAIPLLRPIPVPIPIPVSIPIAVPIPIPIAVPIAIAIAITITIPIAISIAIPIPMIMIMRDLYSALSQVSKRFTTLYYFLGANCSHAVYNPTRMNSRIHRCPQNRISNRLSYCSLRHMLNMNKMTIPPPYKCPFCLAVAVTKPAHLNHGAAKMVKFER